MLEILSRSSTSLAMILSISSLRGSVGEAGDVASGWWPMFVDSDGEDVGLCHSKME